MLFLSFVATELLFRKIDLGRRWRLSALLVKNLRRNPLRTSLTYLASFVLVAVVTIVWSALYVLDHLIVSKARDIKVVMSEKWEANGRMPLAYARPLCEGAADPARGQCVRPQDAMTWQFYLGTVDPEKQTRESMVFVIAIEPQKAATLMDKIFDDVPQESKQQRGQKLAEVTEFMDDIKKMEQNKHGIILGRKQLKSLGRRVGDRMKITGINYKDIDLEFDIVGTFPPGRYDDTAIMNRDYFNDALDVYPRTHHGAKHPRGDRILNLVVAQVADLDACSRMTNQVETSGLFRNPAVKCETLSAYAVNQLESFRDIMWAMRWVLSPAILVTMALVMANGMGISVRQRQPEIAVLKVLGYRPVQVLCIVLGEAALLGALSGFLSALIVYEGVNWLMDNTDSILPVYVPEIALAWGPAVGLLTGLVGSLAPAWSACRVQVTRVFNRVA
jgi:putative ABC transport system permease protein